MILRFHPAARAEHLDHLRRYHQLQRGLGEQYLADIEAALGRVVEAPNRYRLERPPDIRVITLQRFPFFVIYREMGGEVQVLAVSHFRQRPRYWTTRV